MTVDVRRIRKTRRASAANGTAHENARQLRSLAGSRSIVISTAYPHAGIADDGKKYREAERANHKQARHARQTIENHAARRRTQSQAGLMGAPNSHAVAAHRRRQGLIEKHAYQHDEPRRHGGQFATERPNDDPPAQCLQHGKAGKNQDRRGDRQRIYTKQMPQQLVGIHPEHQKRHKDRGYRELDQKCRHRIVSSAIGRRCGFRCTLDIKPRAQPQSDRSSHCRAATATMRATI
jgi:hypothetical protein